jgi:hypothetical protein
VNIVQLRAALIDHALSLGLFTSVNAHEPKSAPATGGVTGALWVQRIGPATGRSGLTATTVRIEFAFRVSLPMLNEPQDEIDLDLLVATAALMTAYSGDFDLADNIEEVDLLGATGTPLSAEAGYLNQDNRLFRVMVITIPLIVNDVFNQAP